MTRSDKNGLFVFTIAALLCTLMAGGCPRSGGTSGGGGGSGDSSSADQGFVWEFSKVSDVRNIVFRAARSGNSMAIIDVADMELNDQKIKCSKDDGQTFGTISEFQVKSAGGDDRKFTAEDFKNGIIAHDNGFVFWGPQVVMVTDLQCNAKISWENNRADGLSNSDIGAVLPVGDKLIIAQSERPGMDTTRVVKIPTGDVGTSGEFKAKSGSSLRPNKKSTYFDISAMGVLDDNIYSAVFMGEVETVIYSHQSKYLSTEIHNVGNPLDPAAWKLGVGKWSAHRKNVRHIQPMSANLLLIGFGTLASKEGGGYLYGDPTKGEPLKEGLADDKGTVRFIKDGDRYYALAFTGYPTLYNINADGSLGLPFDSKLVGDKKEWCSATDKTKKYDTQSDGIFAVFSDVGGNVLIVTLDNGLHIGKKVKGTPRK